MPFYAVRRGHEPGIYETWSECQKQTVKFKGYQFKKFENKEDAEQFMIDGKSNKSKEARHEPYKKPDKKSAGVTYYAVHKGHKTGIFEKWADCQEQTVGFPGARFKKFDNKEDAEDFVITGKKKIEEEDPKKKKTESSSSSDTSGTASDEVKKICMLKMILCKFL